MEEIENAILIYFDHSRNIDPNLKARAVAYCEQLKHSPSILQLCLQTFSSSSSEVVKFWCLQTLEEIIKNNYVVLDQDKKLIIKNFVVSVLCERGVQNDIFRQSPRPPFLRNKLAHILVMLILVEFPTDWPSVFSDLLSYVNRGSMDVDMFCRIFIDLDDSVISADYHRRPEENAIAVRIKDAMRDTNCISGIVKAWYDFVVYYKDLNEDVVVIVLDTLKRYVTWIDIKLVANDGFMSLFLGFILSEQRSPSLRGAAASCIIAIVSKRMEPKAKIFMLKELRVGQLCQLVHTDLESEFLTKLSALIMRYADELLDCSLQLVPSETSEELKEATLSMLDAVLPTIFFIMQFDDEHVEDMEDIVQFLSKYVNKMKATSSLTSKEVVHIGQMLEVIRYRMRYDPEYIESLNIPDYIGQNKEEKMGLMRKELFTLFRTIGRVAPEATQNYVKNILMAAVRSPNTPFEDIEASISLFYALGETISEDTMKSESSAIAEMIQLILSAAVPFQSHRVIALISLETITRYARFFQHHADYAPLLLQVFLDERGIRHPNQNVSGRASYLFLRIVKALRAQLVPYIDTILQSLQGTLSNFTQFDPTSKAFSAQSFEDATYVFEAVGLLIGMEEVSIEIQSKHLTALLAPLCQRVNFFLSNSSTQNPTESSATSAFLLQTISWINSLSKGFGERLSTTSRPTIGAMFKDTLDVLLQVLLAFPNDKALRSKIISFLHRMIDTLGAFVFPYLPKVVEQLLIQTEPKEMVDFLVLINQLICKFKGSMVAIMEEVFPRIASQVLEMLKKVDIPSGPGSNTEENRELLDLQRTFFIFVQDMTSNELARIFVIPQCYGYLNQLIELLLYAACSHNDMLVRKVCVQIFIKLIKNWCSDSDNDEQVPGFQKFIIENFTPRCCVYSVLDSTFDFQESNTHTLFMEIVAAQKAIYEKCGDVFLLHLATNVLPSVSCPRDVAEQYCLEIKRCDVKDLKTIYKSLVERLRMQQNGTVPFR